MTHTCTTKNVRKEKKVVSMFYPSIYLLIYKTFKHPQRHTFVLQHQWLTSDLFPLNSHEFMCE